jgi:cellobiose phosphorylase
MKAVKDRLVSEAGALLLAPAYDRPVREIGYITRYAAGMRENGGVYTHAATWAISAAAKAKDPGLVGRLLAAIDPTRKDPERYRAEPYVLPGNVDGPDSPLHGRAGWTWYTGSAQWLHRVVCEWVLGVRPEWDGLRFDPCLPPGWDEARMLRPWRGATLDVTVVRDGALAPGEVRVALDGKRLEGTLLPPLPAGTAAKVEVRFRAS